MVQTKEFKFASDAEKKELRNKLGDDKFAVLQRIWAVYNYLLQKGVFGSQVELAAKLRRDKSALNSLLNGKRGVSTGILLEMDKAFGKIFNHDWLLYGHGDMLIKSADDIQKASNVINQAWADNSPNAVVNAAYNGNIVVGEDGKVIKNKYGDSPEEDRRWCPVVPVSMSKQPNFDIFGHITKQMSGNLERLYAGTAPVDVWHYVTDNDLYPYYQKGDCLGLKAYDVEDRRIKTGNVYIVDTKRDGFVFRRFRKLENGDFESYTFNESDPQTYVIPQEDVIRVYSVVLMFRY